MRKILSVVVDGVTIHAPVWKRETVQWIGDTATCPLCKEHSPVRAVCDLIQYGLVDTDLVWTVLRCGRCDKLYAVRYLMQFEKPKKRKKKNGTHNT